MVGLSIIIFGHSTRLNNNCLLSRDEFGVKLLSSMVVSGTVGRGVVNLWGAVSRSSLSGTVSVLTEQGEVIGNRYGNKDAAYYNLEMLVSAAINRMITKKKSSTTYVKSL